MRLADSLGHHHHCPYQRHLTIVLLKTRFHWSLWDSAGQACMFSLNNSPFSSKSLGLKDLAKASLNNHFLLLTSASNSLHRFFLQELMAVFVEVRSYAFFAWFLLSVKGQKMPETLTLGESKWRGFTLSLKGMVRTTQEIEVSNFKCKLLPIL